MRLFLRFAIAFLALTGGVALATGVLGLEFRHFQFWQYHGVLFLIAVTIFPRLTLLLSTPILGGLVWWLSWLFMPRLLVAFLATVNYWYENPVLVVFAWLIALGGESSEKFVVVQGARRSDAPGFGRLSGYKNAKWVDSKSE